MRASATEHLRRFAIHGPCDGDTHYALDPVPRLPHVGGAGCLARLLGGESFALQAPPAGGRTTTLRALARHLREEGATPIVLDTHGLRPGDSLARAEVRLLDQLRRASRGEPRTPGHGPWRIGGPWQMLAVAIDDWSRRTDRPLIALVDDLDRLPRPIAGLLRAQLAASRARAVVLAGVGDVRGPGGGRLGRELHRVRAPAFTAREIAGLYGQHVVATGQLFAEAALLRVARWTGGHPWLVCALARELFDGLAVRGPVHIDDVDRAAARLLDAWPAWFERFTAGLDDPGGRRAALPLLAGGAPVGPDATDDIERARDLGLLAVDGGRAAGGLQLAAILRSIERAMGVEVTPDAARCRRPDEGVDLPRVINTLATQWQRGPETSGLAPFVRAAATIEGLLPPGGVMWEAGYGARQLVGRIDLPLAVRRRQHAVIAIKRREVEEPHPVDRGLSDLDRLLPPGGEGALVLFGGPSTRTRMAWEATPSGRDVLVLRI